MAADGARIEGREGIGGSGELETSVHIRNQYKSTGIASPWLSPMDSQRGKEGLMAADGIARSEEGLMAADGLALREEGLMAADGLALREEG